MAEAPLILTPLKRALATLEEALAAPDSSFVRVLLTPAVAYLIAALERSNARSA